MEEMNNNSDDRNLEIMQKEEKDLSIKNERTLWELSDFIRKKQYMNNRYTRIKRRTKETENLFKQRVDKNFPNL